MPDISTTMTSARLIAYVDEAGCSGGQYGNGSSHFLAMGAIVFKKEDTADILAIFDEARAERKHEKRFKKFSETCDKDNYVLTAMLAKKRVRICQVALHKPSMNGSFIRNHHKEEFQYLVKMLIERISWLAAAARETTNTLVDIVFSEQKMYPYGDLLEYLEKLKTGRERFNCSVKWENIAGITSEPHSNETCMHLADIVTSSVHRAIEKKMHGMTDDRFQRNLAPIIFRKHGVPYGVKLFPSKEIEEMKSAGHFGFLRLL